MRHADLIELKTYPPKKHCLPFMALQTTRPPSPTDLFCLTPKLMPWSESTWLFDLKPCLRYWQRQALKTGRDPVALFEAILNRVFKDYVAVMAAHPWQALVLCEALAKKDSTGLYSLDRNLCQKLYENLDWESWFKKIEELATHFPSSLSRTDRIRNSQKQIRRFVERLCLAKPFSLKMAEATAIQRRFGPLLGRVWRWTFCDSLQTDFAEAFPWVYFAPKNQPTIKRTLDGAVFEWEHLKPFLKEDLNRLCGVPEFTNNENVLALELCLKLDDLSEIKLPVSFRHPLPLHRERPHQKTALAQIYYAFQAGERGTPGIIAWQLRITTTLPQHPQVQKLLNELSATSEELTRLQELDNTLPCPLESYSLSPSFDLQNCYNKNTTPACANSLELWRLAARKRPFYILDPPQPLDISQTQSTGILLEQTMLPWWEDATPSKYQRNYYLLIGTKQELIWAYQDETKTWYQHGIFA